MVSAGFKFLCKSDLEESEAKEMASKNIMLNVFSIHKQVIKAIQGNTILMDSHGLTAVSYTHLTLPTILLV